MLSNGVGGCADNSLLSFLCLFFFFFSLFSFFVLLSNGDVPFLPSELV